MVPPLTSKPTRKDEALVRTPPTIVLLFNINGESSQILECIHPQIKDGDVCVNPLENNKTKECVANNNDNEIADETIVQKEIVTIPSNTNNNQATDTLNDVMKLTPDDIVMGNNEAQIIIFEYSSPTCPHCSHYRSKIFPQVAKKYIEKSLIGYVVREVIGNKQDLDASILINCAPKDLSHKFLDIIYTQQSNWAYNINYKDNLTNIWKIGGLAKEQYDKCLESKDLITKLISITNEITKNPIFVGTPTFFIKNKNSVINVQAHQVIKTLDEIVEK
jgi:protein-disulfide isomerase